jgi:Flp pilus assembly protein CpaB
MPVATLVVTPEEAQKLELAKNEGKISLSLRNPLDAVNTVDGKPVTTDVLDPEGNARNARNRRGRNFEDPSVLAALKAPPPKPVKPTPPPPRVVIDVFRGDKHVQEVFHD